MKEKLKQYVEYYFRFDKRDDIEEIKAEVLANLIDRYEENLETHDQEESYVEAIKSMGDFYKEEEIIEEPLLADTGLLVSLIVSIFSILSVLFSAILGIVMVVISIALFAASSYYLIRHSKVVLDESRDLDRMKYHLQKIFSYMKASFTFWSISLSFLGASLLYNFILSIAFVGGMNSGFSIDDYRILLLISSVVFVLLLMLFLVISRIFYSRIMYQYYLMTGDKDVESKMSNGLSFVNEKSPNERNEVVGIFYRLFSGRYFISSYFSVFWLISMLFAVDIWTRSNWAYGPYLGFVFMSNEFPYSFGRVLLALSVIILFLVIGASFFTRRISEKLVISGTYGIIMLHIVFVFLGEMDLIEWYLGGPIFGYFFLMGLLTMIVLVLRVFLLPSKRDE